MVRLNDYLHSKAASKRIPIQGTFELSPVCNFSCKMCYIRRTAKEVSAEGKKLIPWQEWLKLGKKCYDAGMMFLLLTGGEPFIYPGFKQLYEELHKMGIVIVINSNGTMIDADTVEWLKTMAPSKINITLYGASSKTYEKLCGTVDGYERAKNAILMLREAGITVSVNASMVPDNADDLEDIIRFTKEHDLNVRMTTYMFPPLRRGLSESESRLTPEEAASLHMRKVRCILDDDDVYADFLEKKLQEILKPDDSCQENWGSNLGEMRCRAGRCDFWVSWEGEMTACGMLSFPLVTYPFKEEFTKCWEKLHNAVSGAKVMSACNSCEKKEICHPCVAQIYTELKETDGKPPYMCETTDHIIAMMKHELKELRSEQR